MPRKILIVDDSEINRTMLRKILHADYDILEAENGKEALSIIHRSYKFLSAVLLDIVMPEMNGYEVLKQMHSNSALSQIPVIVTTGNTDGDAEIKALKLGANDFITKPYVPDVIKHRLKNTINLRETAAAVNVLQRDRLTGLYTREAFFLHAADMIKARPAGHYVMSCFDIDSFKVINDQYGSEKGDAVLRQVADVFREGFGANGGLVGRITADNFAVLYPVSFMDSEQHNKMREAASVLDGSIPPISFSIGRYVVDDTALPPSAMYDRAALAAATVKGRFDIKVALYDESMLEQLLHEQAIENDMKQALIDRQFEVWLQPQYNHSSGALIGAEALVRWQHPEKGLIPPGVFIPVFERNGFVYELDKYVWEQTCILLRQWIDAGMSPLPVSVNVSRYDVFRDDLIEVITGLVHRYDIPTDLLRLEITETAFAKSTEKIIHVVNSLIDNGFTVEIDDFGSGYSSLNTLKDVPAQIVKLDMRFLENGDKSGRGGNILESVVRMTKWLGMAVIAEGVETIEQANYLKSIGCSYVQGYLYARPMPKDEYETLTRSIGKEEKLLMLETVENLDNSSFWDPKSMDTLIFNTYVGGACIFEWHNGKIEILRANDKYAKTLGGENCTVEDALSLKWEEHMDAAAAQATQDAIERTIETGDDATFEAVFYDLFGSGEETHLRTTFRAIARTTGRYLLYATNENLTAQRKAELEKNMASEQLQIIMDSIIGAVTAGVIRNGIPTLLFANAQYYEQRGYTKEQYEAEGLSPHDLMHPGDRERVVSLILQANETNKPFSAVYRIVRRDGTVRWLQNNITMIRLPGIDTPVQLAVASDVTALHEAEQRERELSERMQAIMDNAGSGITAVILDGDKVDYLFTNDRYYELHGYTKEQYMAEVGNVFELIHPDDRQRVYKTAQEVNEFGRTAAIEYRVTHRDGKEVWIKLIISTRRFVGIDKPVQFSIYTDVTTEKLAQLQILSLNENLQNMMNDMPGAFARLRVLPDGMLATEYVNENMCRLRGMTFDEIMSSDLDNAMNTVHPDDQARAQSTVAELIATGETKNIQYRLKHSSGSFIPVNAFGRVSKNEAGETFINAYYTDLSEQEQKDYTIRETMPFILSAIMQSASDSVFAKDKDLRYICCSPVFLRMAGYDDESEVIGKTDYELFPKETADLFRESDRKLLAAGEPLIDYLEPIPSDDGKQHYSLTSKYILRDTTGEIIGIYGIGRDVTRERTALEQLQLLTNNIPGGIATYEVSPDGIRLTYFNDGFCNMFGYTREEYAQIASAGITTITFEEDVPEIMAQIDALRNHGTPLDCTYRVHTKDGGFIWVNGRGNMTDLHGDVCNMNVVLFDVTKTKLAEEAALIHEQEMRMAISQMGRMLCEYDPVIHTLTVPESFAALYGVPAAVPDVPESLIKAGTITEDTLPAYREFYDAIMRGEKTGSAEYCDRRSDGTLHWERVEFSNIFDSDGKPVKTLIAVEDTTELHRRFELERSRPILGEENIIGRALSNLSQGGEVLEYFDKNGNNIPKSNQTETYGDGRLLGELIPDENERELYRKTHDTDYLLGKYARGITEHSIEYRRRMLSGDIDWVRNDLRLMRQPGGSDILMFEYCYSIEDEKTKELMYGAIVNESYDYVARISGISRRFSIIANAGVQHALPPESGDDFNTVAHEIAEEYVHPDDREMMLTNMLVDGIKANLDKQERFRFVYRLILPGGEIRYKKISQNYMDRMRDIIIVMREDVTELMGEEARKNELLEAALKAANEESRVKERQAAAQLKAIMNNVDGGMSAATLIDGQIGYLFVNDAYYSMFGYTKEQFESELPRGLVDIIHPDDLQMVYDMAQMSLETGSEQREFRVRRRDGHYIWVRSINSTCEIEGVDAPVHIAVLMDISQERETANNLRMSEEQFRIAATIGGRRTARYDIKTGVYYHDDAFLLAQGFGTAIENVPQVFIDSGQIMPESAAACLEFYDRIKRGEKQCTADIALSTGGDSYQWTRGDAVVIFDGAGNPSQAIIVFSDITEQREKEAVYRKWQQSLQQRPQDTYTLFRCNISKNSSFDSMEGSLLQVDFSPEACSFDVRTREYVNQCVLPEDREKYLAFMDSDTLLASYYRGNRIRTLEYRESQRSGDPRWLRLTVELVEYPSSTDVEVYLMYEDIDAQKKDELQNKQRAQTDPLTGILNRVAFAQAVEDMIAGSNPSRSLAIMMLDIDGFKLINDTFGHVMGDQVLKEIAASLRGVLRQGDALGRLGGDEFMVCLRDMPDDKAIQRKASQICSLLHKAIDLDVFISASIGIAVYPRDGSDFETLYRKMDTALYVVKEHGKNNYAFFSEGMGEEYFDLADVESGTDTLAKQNKKRRILVVDDQQISLAMLSKMFENEFIVETATDGNEALAIMRRHGASIACVLLDLVMPGMDGFAVLEKMRSTAELQSIPVVVVSGMDEHETSLRTIRCGAADFVTKPVNADLLRLRVQSAISRADSDRLRAHNSILLLHNTETAKYRTAMESAGATVIEYEPASGLFLYDTNIEKYIDAELDDRPLWDILLSAGVASAEDAETIKRLAESAASEDDRAGAKVTVALRTPAQKLHKFQLSAKKRVSSAGFPDRVVLTLFDMGECSGTL